MAATVKPAPETVSMAFATSYQKNGTAAVAELASLLGDGGAAPLVLAFVAPGYDLDAVATALHQRWDNRVVACTSAGNIGADGYQDEGILAVALSGGGLCARTVCIDAGIDVVDAVCQAGPQLVGLRSLREQGEVFGILLVDGLATQQDRLAATLRALLGDVPIVGGSAGDNLTFNQTAVYADGRFRPNSATFTLVSTRAPFDVVRLQHHKLGEIVLVATEAVPDERLLIEINGRPAATAYAEAVGVDLGGLSSSVFSAHPLLLRAAGEHWIRSVAAALPDGALRLFAGVDRGDVLHLGHPSGMLPNLERCLASVEQSGKSAGVLAFDCVLRKIEARNTGVVNAVNACLSRHRVVGLSTYGEQFNGMNVNHTMAAVAFVGAGTPEELGAQHADRN